MRPAYASRSCGGGDPVVTLLRRCNVYDAATSSRLFGEAATSCVPSYFQLVSRICVDAALGSDHVDTDHHHGLGADRQVCNGGLNTVYGRRA